MKENGKSTKCMYRNFFLVRTELNMLFIISKTKSRATKNCCGLMVDATKENGLIGDNMGMELLPQNLDIIDTAIKRT